MHRRSMSLGFGFLPFSTVRVTPWPVIEGGEKIIVSGLYIGHGLMLQRSRSVFKALFLMKGHDIVAYASRVTCTYHVNTYAGTLCVSTRAELTKRVLAYYTQNMICRSANMPGRQAIGVSAHRRFILCCTYHTYHLHACTSTWQPWRLTHLTHCQSPC